MRLASTGKVNTTNVLTAIGLLGKTFLPANLPICVDFDHVFDPANPTRCFARSNIENPSENLFYVTEVSQSILNQVEAGVILPGKYFSLLPCKSVAIEDGVTYANNLVVGAFIVSELDPTAELANVVKSVYDAMGVVYKVNLCEDSPHCVKFVVNGVKVCVVETFKVNDYYVTTADVISEPVFSIARTLVN